MTGRPVASEDENASQHGAAKVTERLMADIHRSLTVAAAFGFPARLAVRRFIMRIFRS
jgi:hypothetical protein